VCAQAHVRHACAPARREAEPQPYVNQTHRRCERRPTQQRKEAGQRQKVVRRRIGSRRERHGAALQFCLSRRAYPAKPVAFNHATPRNAACRRSSKQ